MKLKTIAKVAWAITPLVLILIMSLYFVLRVKNDNVQPKPEKVTDTLYMDKPYPVTQLKRDTLKPDVVIFWEIDSTQLKEYEMRIHDDSIIILGLRDSIRISKAYLETFPKYPKLLGLDLFRDSLNLTTISINGLTKTEKYELQLQDYNYYWTIDGFGYKKASYKKERVNPFSHYLGLHYDFLRKKPLPTYQIRLNLGKIECNFSASQELYFTEKPEIRIGLNYKLNRR